MTELSEVQKTIIETLTGLNPLWLADYGVLHVLKVGENRLRLHTVNERRKINVDIVYRPGSDLYDLHLFKLGRDPSFVTVLSHYGCYFDELNRLIQSDIHELIWGKAGVVMSLESLGKIIGEV